MSLPAPTQCLRSMTVLDCTDMTRSIAFYKTQLGFTASTWGEPPTFAILQRGHVTVALALMECGKASVSRNWATYIYVRDVDALYRELLANGTSVPEPPETRPYNCREIVVDDPDGHIIAFGQVLVPDPFGPGLSDQLGRDTPLEG